MVVIISEDFSSTSEVFCPPDLFEKVLNLRSVFNNRFTGTVGKWTSLCSTATVLRRLREKTGGHATRFNRVLLSLLPKVIVLCLRSPAALRRCEN